VSGASRTRTGDSWVANTLTRMQGLRDRPELEPALEKAPAEAPNEANRSRIESMLEVVRRPPPIEALRAQPVEAGDRLSAEKFSPCPCPICCIVGCLWCGINCALCCNLACAACPVDILIPRI
jgi:hypothetical protein